MSNVLNLTVFLVKKYYPLDKFYLSSSRHKSCLNVTDFIKKYPTFSNYRNHRVFN